MSIRNLFSIQDIPDDLWKNWWDGLYDLCCEIIADPAAFSESCHGKILATLFYQPSTRTQFSFQSAMLRLGGSVFGFADASNTSVDKGESLADTVRIAANYSDAIVMRTITEGAAKAAEMYSEVPVINAGDGGHFHPTQTLTDLTTISKLRGSLENFRIGLCGDLKYGRTVHSLINALARFPGVRFTLISSSELSLPDYMIEFMRDKKLDYVKAELLEDCVPELDVLYMTRVQRERLPVELQEAKFREYILTKEILSRAHKDMLVMHPLPRVGEIATDVDLDPRAVYFEQARYGMYIRMALLYNFLQQGRKTPPPVVGGTGTFNCSNDVCVTKDEPYLPPFLSASDNTRCGYCDKKLVL